MSFRCDFCSKAQPSGAAPHLVVTKMRKRDYPAGDGVFVGSEVAEEKRACDACFPSASSSAARPAFDAVVDARFDRSSDN